MTFENCCLLGRDPENGASTFHRIVSKRLPDYISDDNTLHNHCCENLKSNH
jgi:hypothetical protein